MDIDKIKAEEWGYIAGFIEGDGSIGITKYHSRGVIYMKGWVSVHNTEKSILDWLQSKLGGSVCYYKARWNDTRFKNRKKVWAWVLNIEYYESVLTKIIPWLHGVKKQKAKRVLQLHRIKQQSPRRHRDKKAQAIVWRNYNSD